MSQTKSIAIALAYDSREEAQYRRMMADLEQQWEQDATLEDLAIGITEDAPLEMYYPAVLVSPAAIPNVLICQNA